MIDRLRQAVESEIAYTLNCLPRGIRGLNVDQFRDDVQLIVDR